MIIERLQPPGALEQMTRTPTTELARLPGTLRALRLSRSIGHRKPHAPPPDGSTWTKRRRARLPPFQLRKVRAALPPWYPRSIGHTQARTASRLYPAEG